jgi:GNAT superfamily N-acetyltransferase
VIEIRPLAVAEVELVDSRLPLSRLEQPGGDYLVAWDHGEPVGHAHVDWRADPPELQDVLVAESHRRQGIASALTAATEELVRERGYTRFALTVSAKSPEARALYEKLGYRATGDERRVQGTIVIRGQPLEVDDTLVTLEKLLED